MRFMCKRLFLLFFAVLLAAHSSYAEEKLLGFQDFYGGKTACIPKGGKFDPYNDPQWGYKTDGKPVASPTKVAGNGLCLALTGDVDRAKAHARWLLDNSVEKNGALFFPFLFEYAPVWPYSFKAPWVSGLTQGLSLGLFTYLYKKTGEEEFLKTADRIYASYSVPVEKGGFTRLEKDGPFFEEYPAKVPIRVLNGAAVAIIALHDYAVITGNKEAESLFEKSAKRLAKLLPEYELTDPSGTGIIVSSYSLAPTRPEVLGRFRGKGDAIITGIRLYGVFGGGEKYGRLCECWG